MSSKTKIIVLHMKEVVYTAVFLALALILLVVFLIMFSGKKDSAKKPSVTTAASAENARYIPGIYTSTISLGNQRSEERRVGKECRSRWSPYH